MYLYYMTKSLGVIEQLNFNYLASSRLLNAAAITPKPRKIQKPEYLKQKQTKTYYRPPSTTHDLVMRLFINEKTKFWKYTNCN